MRGAAELDADVIIVGSGHNGLVCGAYLAKWGYQVLVLERRSLLGGAVSTEEMFDGFQMDLGGSLHCMIRATPIVEELNLRQYGLDYIPLDPILTAPFEDGTLISIYRDLDRTCESIARVSQRDAESYRAFVEEWRPLNSALFDLFLSVPTPMEMGRRVLARRFHRRGSSRVDLLRRLFQSYGRLIEDTFEHEKVRAMMSWWGAQSGPPPTEAMSSGFISWQSLLHDMSPARPRGGSGMLCRALARCIEHHGGELLPATEVQRILVDNGRAVGVETAGGHRYHSRCVVSNAHVRTTFLQLLDHWTPPQLRRRVEQIRLGNGFGMMLRCAMDALPRYRLSEEENAEAVGGVQLLCPSVQYLHDAYSDWLRGIPARHPAAIAMTFSAIDESIAPPGKHTLFLWGQYYPYRLRDDVDWQSIERREAERLLGVLERFAPGTRRQLRDLYIQTPPKIASLHGMPNANIMHVDMSIDQMFLFRPLPELARYATPLRGLFLASAGMHPGGGIFGAAGYNCSRVLHTALRRRFWGRGLM